MHVRCSVPECGTTLELHDRSLACPRCGDLLEVVVDQDLPDASLLKQVWVERRRSYDPRDTSGVWRFREFLPNCYGDSGIVTISEGNVPVVHGRKTAQW